MVENVTLIKSGITINVGVSVKIKKSVVCVKKKYICNPAACSLEKSQYFGNIIDNSGIKCNVVANSR